MITRENVTRVLDAAYAPETSEKDWLDGILHVAGAAFESFVPMHAFTFEVAPEGTFRFRTVTGSDPYSTEQMIVSHGFANAADIRAAYLSGPISQVSRVIRRTKNPRIRAIFDVHMGQVNTVDVVGAVGLNPSGRGCALGFGDPRRHLTREARLALSRLGGHLATAFRLRESNAPVVAQLHPDGARVHVEAACKAPLEPDMALGLQRAALEIDRAKRFAPTHPDVALEQWRAMVDGRFTLVERYESDGRRLWVAHENEPHERFRHKLTAREARVVALAAMSRPAKLIAYELGYSEGCVSKTLSSALTKLGLRSRSELVEVHGALIGHESSATNDELRIGTARRPST